ncbi:MAG: biotin--[acetyl-CoA-carboxylase] ligase, partial [Bacteroidota bacterium]
LQSSIVGIGININQTHFISDAPNPTSFTRETGQEFDLDEMVSQLCHYVERRYLQLRGLQDDLIRQDYLNNLFRFMEDALYRDLDNRIFSGRIIGVSPLGQLLLDTLEGQRSFGMKEVQFIL